MKLPKKFPSETYYGDDYTVLVLDNGNKIVSSAVDRFAGDFVMVVSADDEEIGYWDSAEWKDDPVVVMGAIIRAAAMKAGP